MNKSPDEISTEGKNGAGLLERLKEIQERYGYLSRESLVEVAQEQGLPVSEAYGVATFYSFLATKPQGRNVIRICKSLPCFIKGADMIIDSVKKELGIKPGDSTPDGRFSFELTNCIGGCDKAPAMMVNNDYYNDLTPGKIARILEEYK